MSGFDTHSKGDILPHWAHWLQPSGMRFPRLGRDAECGERAKDPSAALTGAGRGKRTHDKVLLAPVARHGKAGGGHARLVCVHVISFYSALLSLESNPP